MFIFTSIFGYVFSITILILVLPFILLQNILKNNRFFDPLVKFICHLIPLSFGIRVKTVGKELLDPEKNYVFIANHVNIFDPILLFGFIPHIVRGVELESHFNWPVWGAVVRGLGNIPISQKDVKSALESLEKAGQVIKEGTSIAMFPEGHRTRDGKLQTFQRGPFRLVRNAEVDMVPVVLKGLWERKTIHSLFVKPGTVEIIFSKPIPAQEIQESSDRELRSRSKEIIQAILS
jgi:1-acyl-sn-glycerol-3-phosphate acyltransferase